MKKIFLSLLLLSNFAFGQVPLSKSSLRSQGCDEITQKFCVEPSTNKCLGVYVALSTASEKCKNATPGNIQSVCGSPDAKIFETGKECMMSQANITQDKAIKNIKDIKQSNIEQVYSYTGLHKNLCKELCGSRYDKNDIRNFNQTGGKPGLLCSDESMEASKNGMKYTDDPTRKSCLETHAGNYTWCINYNKSFNGVDFGAFVACAARIQ